MVGATTCTASADYADYSVTDSGGTSWNNWGSKVSSITAYLVASGGSPSATLQACTYTQTQTSMSGACSSSSYTGGGTISLTSLTTSWGLDTGGTDFNELNVSATSGSGSGDSITILGVVIQGT